MKSMHCVISLLLTVCLIISMAFVHVSAEEIPPVTLPVEEGVEADTPETEATEPSGGETPGTEATEPSGGETPGTEATEPSGGENPGTDATEPSEDEEDCYFEYTVTDGKATVTKYTGSEKHVVVPATLGGYPVYTIGSHAFYGNDDIESLTFSEGIVNLECESIMSCRFLKSIHFPSTMILYDAASNYTGLGVMPSYCYSLKEITVAEGNPYAVVVDNVVYTKDRKILLKVPEGDTREILQIPDGVEEISSDACAYNEYIKQIIMPDTVTYIGYWAFNGCSKLEKLNISENCKFIGQYAFQSTKLTTFHFPAAVEAIMAGAFGYMGKETTITVDENNPYYYAEDNVLFAKTDAGICLLRYPAGHPRKEYSIPDGVQSVAFAAFGSEILSDLHLPESLIRIDETAFVGYADLTVYYPENSSIWTEETRAKYPFFVTWVEESSDHTHTSIVVSGKEATCTQDGLTEGKKCSVCGAVMVAQKTIPTMGHSYDDNVDGTCNVCFVNRETAELRQVHHMLRMYNPNTGEHFYTGSEEEKNNLVAEGWNYEGVAFTFPKNTGAPVHRLFQPSTGEHLYTMDEAEKADLMANGWNYEGIAFNSAYDTEAVQHRLHNPNATVGAYHFTFSEEEMQNLIAAGWEYQGIGWYSCWK